MDSWDLQIIALCLGQYFTQCASIFEIVCMHTKQNVALSCRQADLLINPQVFHQLLFCCNTSQLKKNKNRICIYTSKSIKMYD